MIVSGCGTTQIAGTADKMCQDWREIGVRKADVIGDETAREIIGNNKSRDAWCAAKKA